VSWSHNDDHEKGLIVRGNNSNNLGSEGISKSKSKSRKIKCFKCHKIKHFKKNCIK